MANSRDVYLTGSDEQGSQRVIRVSEDKADEMRDLVEWALEPPYGTLYPMSTTEVRRLARAHKSVNRTQED